MHSPLIFHTHSSLFKTELTVPRSEWVSRVMRKHPIVVELRERSRPLSVSSPSPTSPRGPISPRVPTPPSSSPPLASSPPTHSSHHPSHFSSHAELAASFARSKNSGKTEVREVLSDDVINMLLMQLFADEHLDSALHAIQKETGLKCIFFFLLLC